MTYNKIIAIIIATLALFFWNAASWMALPFHNQSLKTLPDQVLKFSEISTFKLEEGVYHYPGIPQDNSNESLKKIKEKLNDGPRIPIMVYRSGPTSLFDPMDFFVSFLSNLFVVVCVFLLMASQNTYTWTSVIINGILIGVIVSTAAEISKMNWFDLPWSFTLPYILDHLIGILIISVVYKTLYSNSKTTVT